MATTVIVPIVPIVRGHHLSAAEILAAVGIGLAVWVALIVVGALIIRRVTR